VTVLQAWFGTSVTSSVQPPAAGGDRFDQSLCSGEDCTAAAAALLRRDGAAQPSPFVNVFRYSPDSSGRCEVVELRTVTRDGALAAPTFAGLGFWFAGSFGFATPAQLDAVGHVTLSDGSPATVHRFLAQGMCFGLGGNSSAIASRHFEFKPYARYDVAGTATQYRNWDDVASDYRLGRAAYPDSQFVASFDRQGELLAR
jgi:hypothetical protein